jgi:hypothetical protein
LSYGFVEVTGEAVDIARITAFSFGTGAVLFVTGLAISLAVLRRELGTTAARDLLARVRGRLRGRERDGLAGGTAAPAALKSAR